MDTKSTGGSLNSGAAPADRFINPRERVEEFRRDLHAQRRVAQRRRAQAEATARRPHEKEITRIEGLLAIVDEELTRSHVDLERVEKAIWKSVRGSLVALEAEARALSKVGSDEEQADAASSADTYRTIIDCMDSQTSGGSSVSGALPSSAAVADHVTITATKGGF